MMKFFRKPSDWILGCDPGPEHSAFALLDCRKTPKVAALSYVPNGEINVTNPGGFVYLLESLSDKGPALVNYGDPETPGGCFAPVGGRGVTYAFERCAVQAGGANAMVFETCMVAGELRYILRRNPFLEMHSFTPSEWRYVITGKGSAKDANVRDILLTLFPECDILCRSYSRKAKAMHELKKPITPHLRDAIGVAAACGLVGFRQGLELSQFPARLEVHCG